MARILLAKARFLTGDIVSMTPPLGIMYLAAVLRDLGHSVRIYDPGPAWRDLRLFRRALLEHRPDLLGISAITFEADVLAAMATEARRAFPDLPIVVGGPHATSYPEQCARLHAVDFVVVGEGEQTIAELVDAVVHGSGDPRAIPGVASIDGSGDYRPAAQRLPIEDLDTLPYPAWELIDLELYARNRSMSTVGCRRYMAVSTSRGCPYGCIYCHQVHGKRFRARSPESVIGELEALRARHGVADVEIVDDIFNLDPRRMRAILEHLATKRERTALHFPNGLRTDLLDGEQIGLLRRAGTLYLAVAVETASERLQAMIGKRLEVARVRENIDLAVRSGMFVNGLFMLGFPTETLEEAYATVDLAVSSSLHQAYFFRVTPFQGTALFEACKERSLSYARFSDLEYSHGTPNLSAMTDVQLRAVIRRAYDRFYLDPRRLVRLVARHPKKLSLALLAVAAVHRMLPRPGGNRAAAEVGFLTEG